MTAIAISRSGTGYFEIQCDDHGNVGYRGLLDDAKTARERHGARFHPGGWEDTDTADDYGVFTIQASDLGLAPGHWPHALLLPAQPAHVVNGEIAWRDYRIDGLTVRVLND